MKSSVKVLVPSLKFDPFFNMYFRESEQFLVDDNGLNCSPGDWLLIRKLDQPLSLRINHKVEKLVYKAGNVIDPLTGKKSLGYQYDSDAKRHSNLFGLKPSVERGIKP